jgi:hypothetical protein
MTAVTARVLVVLVVVVGCQDQPDGLPPLGGPGMFALVRPIDSARNVPVSPVFEWTPSARAESYLLEVSTAADFSALVEQSSVMTNSATPHVPLEHATTYYWRVQAINSHGRVLAMGSPSQFSTLARDFTQVMPADGATDVPRMPVLSWTAYDGATTYRLQVSIHPDLSLPAIDEPGLTATNWNGEMLAENVTYYWRVFADGPQGQSVAVTGIWSFMTMQVPDQFLLVGPADGATQVPLSVTYTWTALADAQSYVIELDLTSAFSNPQRYSGETGTSFTQPLQLDISHRYWWRMSAITNSGMVVPAANGPFSFTTVGDNYGTLVPRSGTLHDIVYDGQRNRVYLSNETTNVIETFDASAGVFLPSVSVPGTPWGIDMTADRSKLVVALPVMFSTGSLAVLDLTVDPPALISTIALQGSALSVGCAANGKCLVGDGAIDEINVSTGTVTMRAGATDETYIKASHDRSHLAFAFGNVSNGNFAVYDSATDSFVASIFGTNNFNDRVAISADGRTIAVSAGILTNFFDDSGAPLGYLDQCNGAIVFSPLRGLGRCGATGGELAALDVDRFIVLDRVGIPADIGRNAAIDDAGRKIYAIANGGLLIADTSKNLPAVLEPIGTISVDAGETVGLTIEALDPDGDPLVYSATGLPANATFDQATHRLTFSPTLSQVGTLPAAQITVTDGTIPVSQSVTFVVTNPPRYGARTIPINGDAGEIVIDGTRELAYVANQTRARIERFDLATSTRLDPIPVGSYPFGVDLTPTADRLVVCPSEGSAVQIFDITVEPPVLSSAVRLPSGSLSPFPHEVAVASNGHALIGLGGIVEDIGDLDLSAGTISVRTDHPRIYATPSLRASGDRQHIIFVANGPGPVPIFLYQAATNSFTTPANSSASGSIVDANADGTQFIINGNVLSSSLGQLGVLANGPAAFRQGRAEAYTANSSNVSSWDLTTLSSGDSFALSGPIDRMRTDATGTRLVVTTGNNGAGDGRVSIVTLP